MLYNTLNGTEGGTAVDMKLAENIRAFRKERALTQEQLAEVLGVTVGAVHKWEARLSVPELPLIVEMADLFDTSVDAMLGYEMKDNRLEATVGRLWQYHADKDGAGLAEAEKAMKKYPNAFGVVYASATLFHGIGLEAHDSAALRRALELFEKARCLLQQNQDATISDQTLCSSIAQVYFALGEREKAVRLMEKQNAGNRYSLMIGAVLATELNRPEEALPHLSRGMLLTFNDIIYAVLGFSALYQARRDCEKGQAVLRWGIRTLQDLKASDKPDFTDKVCAVFYACLAYFQMAAGGEGAARESLGRAMALAKRFDANPDYSAQSFRFIGEFDSPGACYDVLGTTAVDAVENTLKEIPNQPLNGLWKELKENEE